MPAEVVLKVDQKPVQLKTDQRPVQLKITAPADVLLKLERKPVQLGVSQAPVQLVVSGGRGPRGLTGQPAIVDAQLMFQGRLVANEKLGFGPLAGAVTYTAVASQVYADTGGDAPEVL